MKLTRHSLVFCFAVPLVVVLARYLIQAHIGINLHDEGYLWYGAQRILHGEIPIRDYASYDPARYFYSALVMFLLGDSGIGSLRISLAICQFACLFLFLYLCDHGVKTKRCGVVALVVVASTLIFWIHPRYKVFEVLASILLIFAIANFAEKRTPVRAFISGLIIGGVATLSRQHGVYGVVAVFLLLLYSLFFQRQLPCVRALIFGAFGIVLGFSPIFLLCIFYTGFYEAFITSLMFLFSGSIELHAQQVPWPWTIDYSEMNLSGALYHFLVGGAFLLAAIFGILGVLACGYKERKGDTVPSAMLACFLVSVLCSHYIFYNADLPHLAINMAPILLGLVLITRQCFQMTSVRTILLVSILLGSVFVMRRHHPYYIFRVFNFPSAELTIATDTLIVNPKTKDLFDKVDSLNKEYVADSKPILFVPFYAGLYAAYNRKSPTWTIYNLFPASEEIQNKEISSLKANPPAYVLINRYYQRGNPDLDFFDLHPKTFAYIQKNYIHVPEHPLSDEHELYIQPSAQPH